MRRQQKAPQLPPKIKLHLKENIKSYTYIMDLLQQVNHILRACSVKYMASTVKPSILLGHMETMHSSLKDKHLEFTDLKRTYTQRSETNTEGHSFIKRVCTESIVFGS